MNRFLSRKPVIVALALVALIAANIGLYQLNRGLEQNIITEEQPQNISVQYSVLVPGAKEKTISLSVPSDATALEALEQFFPVETTGKGPEAYITAINAYKASSEKKEFWAFYVNNKQAAVGAGSYKLQNGDVIIWKIETYE